MTDKRKKTESGVLKINNDVIASIARNAALQVNGVQGVKTNSLSMILDIFHKGYHRKGISLDINENENEIKIGITIIVRYGVNIPEIATLVQESIRNALEDMTGLSVAEVDVSIGDIHSETDGN
ncbi:MAG: Asp23/Gls24 family envelope stress response protein [Candidatus Omnitrophica bacterium]|nr:Asp23/Gls24 family envelope stress response protein [Candidatus Omnitrophota bacterium]MBU4478344.1 Asp23/Gls24 family envelope stress response protein [Candidatus Omnitrophota bacterium]MCG2704262.1 Asp23/Gls24 family envelope stress response protein [Candidatus Omnitrophota bacterium]